MIDTKISLFLQKFDSPLLHQLFNFYTNRIYMILATALIMLIILNFKKEKGRKILYILIPALINFYLLVEILLKNIIVRIRPYLSNMDIQGFGQYFSDSSFPSSHVTITTIICLSITYAFPKQRFIAYTLIFLMIIARIYNGMHYFSDTIAGLLLGIGIYLLWKTLFELKEPHRH